MMADDLTSLPPEYLAEMEALQRKRALAQALLKQSMGFEGAKSIGPVAARTSPLAWLANAATGYLGSQVDSAGAKGMRDVQARANDEQRSEAAGLLALPEDQQFTQGQQAKFKQNRLLAEALQKQRETRLGKFADIAGKDDPQVAAQALINNRLPSSYVPTPVPPLAFQTDPAGNTLAVSTDRNGVQRPTYAPKPNVVHIDNAGETSAAKAVGAKLPDRFDEITKGAQKAITSMESARRIRNLLSDPNTLTGFGASVAEGLSSLGTKFGFTGPDAAAKTQGLMSELAGQTLASVSKLPGAITEKERPFLAEASAGRVEWTPQAIQRLADIAEMAGHNSLIQLHKDYSSIAGTSAAQTSKATEVWPFPMGWNFEADPKKYKETGSGTNRYQYIGDIPGSVAPAKANSPSGKYRPVKEMSKEEIAAETARLEALLRGQ